jgi:hypothetical protein|tara:strand:+ start:74 stop:862 length:789 start_codon:yes stop_codon:yes gene_type:complete
MAYIGNQIDTGFTSLLKQDLTGASGTTLTLSHAVANANDIALYINNVRQEPTTAYTVNNTTVNLTGTVSGTDDIYVIYLARAVQTTVPPDSSVSTAKIADSAVTLAKTSGLPFGKILQAVAATPVTADQGGVSSSSWKYGGIQVAITPSSTSSKIFVIVNGNPYFASGGDYALSIHRNITSGTSENTVITGGTNLGHADKGLGVFQDTNGNHRLPISLHILDSPNSTSQQTYSYSIRTYSNNSHTGLSGGMTAQMTAFEIGA